MISNELLKYTILKTAIYGKFVKTTSKFKIFDLDKVVDVIPTKHFQIKQSEIKKEGKYPVVSQSQSLIEGYSNDYDKVFRPNSSCVIFGDHSKTIKYIDFPFIVGADGTKVIQPKSMLNSKYLYYHLIYNVAQIKSTGYTRNFKYLKKLKLYIPPLEEQEKIVKKIEELFELIDKKEKNDEEKEKLKVLLKEKILDSAIHGKLVENDLTLPTIDVEEIKEVIPFDVPSNWKWSKLSSIFEIKGGKRIPKGYTFSDAGNHVYIRVADMGNMTIKTTNLKYIDENVFNKIKNYIITDKDLYITVAGTIGQVGSVPKELNGMNLTENANRLIPKKINKEFYKYILNCHFMQKKIKESTTKSAQPKLAIKRIKELIIPIPPLEQQKKIVEKIEECFKLIEQL